MDGCPKTNNNYMAVNKITKTAASLPLVNKSTIFGTIIGCTIEPKEETSENKIIITIIKLCNLSNRNKANQLSCVGSIFHFQACFRNCK